MTPARYRTPRRYRFKERAVTRKLLKPARKAVSQPVPETPRQPISEVCWVDPAILHANGYNPNRVFSPELALLATSIIEDGWTQPIVARSNGEIVDGFHRWTLGSKHTGVRAVSGGLVPVVRLNDSRNRADQMLSTVRHNRARGQHGILAMGDIVRDLLAEGLDAAAIQSRMGMDREEYDRIASTVRSPELIGKDSFGRSWVPFLPAGETKLGAHKTATRKKSTRGI